MSQSREHLEAVGFPISGMTCTSCVNRITRAVRQVPGVAHVRVDLRGERATVVRDPGVAPDATIAAAVRSAGYEPDLEAATRAPADPPEPLLLTRLLGALRRGRARTTSGTQEPADKETPR